MLPVRCILAFWLGLPLYLFKFLMYIQTYEVGLFCYCCCCANVVSRDWWRREHLLRSAKELETDALDGLSSLAGYSVNVQHGKLFTRFYVDINQKYIMAAASAAAAGHIGEKSAFTRCVFVVFSRLRSKKTLQVCSVSYYSALAQLYFIVTARC